MKMYFKQKYILLYIVVAIFSSSFCFSQDKKHEGVGSVSEIIVPVAASIRNNFNLFYEIHQSKQINKIPSFWYKIIFSKECTFQFTLFPLYEEDGYNFYLFKINENQNFCKAYTQEKIITFNAERLYKTYTDRDQSEQFRANLVDIKPVSVKAGDAIYIEVFSTKGKDRGHILDFRTSDNSFVVKTYNDKDAVNQDNDNISYTPKTIENEQMALDALGSALCTVNNKKVYISSIQIKGEDVKIKQFLDLVSHENKGNKKEETLNKVKDTTTAVGSKKSDSLIIKSTADLNSIKTITNDSLLNYSIVKINSSKQQNDATRLEVDNVLFSLLQEDLKRKISYLEKQIKKERSKLKKLKDKTERKEIDDEISNFQNQRAEFVVKSIDTKHKLKEINRLLREERRKKISSERSVFAKSVDTELKPTIAPVIDSTGFIHVVPLELVYKIQIGVYKNPVSPDLFKGLTPVYEETYPGGVRYSAGAFTYLSDAQQAKEYIRNMGLTDAFIVAYYKGKRITLADAKIVEGNK